MWMPKGVKYHHILIPEKLNVQERKYDFCWNTGILFLKGHDIFQQQYSGYFTT